MTQLLVEGEHNKQIGKKILEVAAKVGGSYEDETDKGALFNFPSQMAAAQFENALNKFGVYCHETEAA